MALRVLLADESTTIKKVMQLALQDFAVEVKSVQSGIDVLEVAKTFQPDIIFADVLLQKKNGYEVCADLKDAAEMNDIPVVLMWSSFMDLDERQAQACRADRRLEKPFDVENLRQIVLELVPKTRSQRLAHFLQFPESVTEPLQDEESAKRKAKSETPPPPPRTAAVPASPPAKAPIKQPVPPPAPPVVAEPPPSNWNMNSFDDISEFAEQVEAEKSPMGLVPPMAQKPVETEIEASDHGPELAIDSSPPNHATDAGEDEDGFDFQSSDEDFQEVRISSHQQKTPERAKPLALAEDQIMAEPTIVAAEDSEEPWSHKNLARFKLDLDPDDEPSAKLTLEVEEGPESLEHGEFLRHVPKDEIHIESDENALHPPLAFTDIQESAYELTDDDTLPINSEKNSALTGEIGKLNSDQLEKIIRAQSKDIIETVVRRMVREIVPDLASNIIREELNRLLEADRGP